MPLLLCIDIGNTHITLGLFAEERLRHHWRLATEARRTEDEYVFVLHGLLAQAAIDVSRIQGAVLASVVPNLTPAWIYVCQTVLGVSPLQFSAALCPEIRIAYDPPQEVGADRLADVLAVHHCYALPACIVDFGTATTFDAVAGDGTYWGGAIAPGMQIAANALFQHTALLPKVDLAPSPRAIGGNTRHALQSGLFWGYASLVEGMIQRFRAELEGDMTVIGTGGLARIFHDHTRIFDHFAPWLTLEGLRLAYQRTP